MVNRAMGNEFLEPWSEPQLTDAEAVEKLLAEVEWERRLTEWQAEEVRREIAHRERMAALRGDTTALDRDFYRATSIVFAFCFLGLVIVMGAI